MPNNPRKNVHSEFDSVGRLANLQVDGVNYLSEVVFNSLDQVSSLKIGPEGVNQISEQYNYDILSGKLENQKVLRGSTALLDLSYEYQQCTCSTGRGGQITSIVNNLNRNQDRKYDYDRLGRLAKVSGGMNQTWSQSYDYDRYGNRVTVESLGFEALRGADSAVQRGPRREPR